MTAASTAFVARPLRAATGAFVSRVDRLVAHLPDAVEERVRDRLGLDLFVVVASVLVVLRLFDVFPWTPWVLDMHTYWATGRESATRPRIPT